MTDCQYFKDVRSFNIDHFWININVPFAIYQLDNFTKVNDRIIKIIDDVENFYTTNKPNTISDNSDGNTNTKSILTHNFNNFNILDHTEYDEIVYFKSFVSQCYQHFLETFLPPSLIDFDKDKQKVEVSCWGNKLSRYDYLDKHVHNTNINIESNFMPSGNYFVKGPGHDTYTRYYHPLHLLEKIKLNMLNEEGHMVLFPNFIFHDTSANRSSDQFRYTLGLDGFFDMTEHGNSSYSTVKLFS